MDADLDALGQLAAAVEPDGLMFNVNTLVDAHLSDTPVDCETFEDVDERFCHLTRVNARALLRSRLEALGYTVTEQHTEDGLFTTRNVLAERRGTTRPDEVVLITAHYDAFWGAADDNSSGVAGLLELARIFSTRDFDRTIRFVGFDLEEVGLVGSTRFVQALEPGDNIVMVLNFDGIGYASDAEYSQNSLPGLPAPSQGNFVAVIANANSEGHAADVRLLSDALQVANPLGIIAPLDGANPISGNLMRSDHAPFWLSGRVALFFTDTANFRNPHYHTRDDHPDTLDPEFLADNVRLAAAAAAYFAGGPR